MNSYLIAAGVLAFVVGLVHSVLGEHLIFRRLRKSGVIPTYGGTLLGERHVRILWASWHIPTVLNWGMSCILFWLASPQSAVVGTQFIEDTIATSMLCSAVLVFVGTKAKHPGWAGLLGVAVLIWLGRAAQ